MGKQVATPKQTAGGGFVFEDKVVAYYLTWMLGSTPLTFNQGPITRVDCQVKVDGWELDDLLITSMKDGQEYRCAFSIKVICSFRATMLLKISFTMYGLCTSMMRMMFLMSSLTSWD
jgi:hypothetical protein